MNNKKQRKQHISRCKKILKHLYKLQKLGYSSSYAICEWLIVEARQDLLLYGVKA